MQGEKLGEPVALKVEKVLWIQMIRLSCIRKLLWFTCLGAQMARILRFIISSFILSKVRSLRSNVFAFQCFTRLSKRWFSLAVKRQDAQKKAFTRWINSKIQKVGLVGSCKVLGSTI